MILMRQFTGSRWLNCVKALVLLTAICSFLGCASLIVRPPKVILLPEERIFTVKAGQNITVYLDHKEMSMTFPSDMKLVSPTVLMRQEEHLNNETLKGIQANQKNKATLGIVGSILAIIGGIVGIIFRKSFWPKINAKVDIK